MLPLPYFSMDLSIEKIQRVIHSRSRYGIEIRPTHKVFNFAQTITGKKVTNELIIKKLDALINTYFN